MKVVGQEQEGMGRRDFLGTAGAVALGLGALGAAGRSYAANEKISTAVIGVGGMGGGHLGGLLGMDSVQVLAVCDVWQKRRDNAAQRAHCKGYLDYGDILARDDIDTVFIATPDHWHKQISIDAMQAGKDVYCEKPITLTWQEAKEVASVARETGRVFQCGAQSASDDCWWAANNFIRQGAIGKVIWSQGGYCRNNPSGDWNWGIDPSANPGNLDWPMWLGPAPDRPWSPERYFRFRKFWDYSGGLATDLLYHVLSHLSVALTPEFPVEVSAIGGNYVHADREVPDTFHILARYPSDHTVLLAGSQASNVGPPDMIRGEWGTLEFQGETRIVPQPPFVDQVENLVASGCLRDCPAKRNEEGKLVSVTIPTGPRSGHRDNFFECVRSREKPHLNADDAYKVMVTISLAVQAYRQGRTMCFDPVNEEVLA